MSVALFFRCRWIVYQIVFVACVHFSVDGDVDKSFSDLIFVFVGEDMGEVFCRLVVVVSDSYRRLFSETKDVDEDADEGEEVGVEDVYCVVFVDIKSKL